MIHERIAVYAGTRNLYPHMVTAAKSLLYHDGADHVFFLAEDDDIGIDMPSCITIRNVSNQTWFLPSSPNFNSHWSYMVLLRAAYTKIFPQYDRILSLDVDTIVNRNIDDLWNTDVSGYYLAAVLERHVNSQGWNAGVMLLNLNELRDGTDDQIISLINSQFLSYNEQDAFNQLCAGKIYSLPCEFNAMESVLDYIPLQKARIMHCANSPKYNEFYWYRKYKRIQWNEIMERKEILYHAR